MTDTLTEALPPRDHNNPPSMLPAEELQPVLAEQYAPLAATVTALLAEIKESAPVTVETDTDNTALGAFVKRLRDTITDIEAKHAAEKNPYLRSGQIVDQLFFGMRDRLKKAREILQRRGDEFTARKVAEERIRRQQEAAAAAAEARRKQEEAAAAERQAAEIQAAADRARKPENIERLQTAANEQTGIAAVKQVDEMIATSNAENAALAAAAPAAVIARNRDETTGLLATAKTAPYVEITDADALDKSKLWPFISEAEKLKALKAWARTTGHKQPMDGAIIEMRNRADYR